jgi:hypothetical protein
VHVNVNANPRAGDEADTGDELPSGATGPAVIRSPSQEPCRDVPSRTDGFTSDDIASTGRLCSRVIAVDVVVISMSICMRTRFERATRAM